MLVEDAVGRLRKWGKFLAATSDEELEQLAMDQPVLKQAKDTLDLWSADDEARLRAEQREMAQISDELDKAWMRRAGKAEVIQQLLTLKFGELSQQVRDRIANGSEPQMMRWSERLLSAGSLEDVFAGG